MNATDTTETIEFQSAAKRALDAEAPALRDRIAVETAKAEAIAAQRTAAQIRDALDAAGARIPKDAKVADLRAAWVEHAAAVLPETTRLRKLEYPVRDQERALSAMREVSQGADKVASEFVVAVSGGVSAEHVARLAEYHRATLAESAMYQRSYRDLAAALRRGDDMEDAARAVIVGTLGAFVGSDYSRQDRHYGADDRTAQQTARRIVGYLARALPEPEWAAYQSI